MIGHFIGISLFAVWGFPRQSILPSGFRLMDIQTFVEDVSEGGYKLTAFMLCLHMGAFHRAHLGWGVRSQTREGSRGMALIYYIGPILQLAWTLPPYNNINEKAFHIRNSRIPFSPLCSNTSLRICCLLFSKFA